MARTALAQKKPITKSWGKVLTIFLCSLELPAITACFIWSTTPLLPLITFGCAIVAIAGTLIYEGFKVVNHRKIIKNFLNMENDIKKLERLRN
jgi:hypothetical protein